MRTSYNNTINYLDLLKVITVLEDPRVIVEFGILDGASLEVFADNSTASIQAYDIFDDFNGNHAKLEQTLTKFKDASNVIIGHGDFYNMHTEFENGSIDLLHIDIANNGDIFCYAIEHYLEKVSAGGLLLLEGGSSQRDQVEWMIKFNKKPIYPYGDNIKAYKHIEVLTVGAIPSVTLIRKL